MDKLNLFAPFIGLCRHRIQTDGEGVTTLAAFHGCPLHCRYCLNPQCHTSPDRWLWHTPETLYQEVKQDELYFLATGGGITFGGGEPLAWSVLFINSDNSAESNGELLWKPPCTPHPTC